MCRVSLDIVLLVENEDLGFYFELKAVGEKVVWYSHGSLSFVRRECKD